MLEKLEKAITENNENAVQDAIFDLSYTEKIGELVPDEISFGIIDILRRDEMKTSPLAGSILNYFQSNDISPLAKHRMVGFLNAWRHEFKHFYSVHVISELETDGYLK